jgi:hypothetical protein
MRLFCIHLLICLLILTNAQGQCETLYKPFSFEMDLGLGVEQFGKTGAVFQINPHYTIANKYRLGVQIGWAVFDEHAIDSYAMTFDYYFMRHSQFQLSAGGGYGFYKNSFWFSQASMPPEEQVNSRNTGQTGGNVRVGFEWRHLCIGIAYHFAPTLYQYTMYNNSLTATDIFRGNYLSLTVGVRIGGEHK